MKETPLLFKPDMVLATLEDRKTKTRRLNGLEYVNTYPGQLTGESALGPLGYRGLMASAYYLKRSYKKDFAQNPGHYHWFLGERVREDGVKELNPIPVKCPYGGVGDLLWVRESFSYITKAENEKYDKIRPDSCPVEMLYRSNALAEGWDDQLSWSPSIHMPRWASRITLEVLDVRVERLQDITLDDIEAEGTPPMPDVAWYRNDGYQRIQDFIHLWNSINAKRGFGWNTNPFVWVVTFRRMEEKKP